ncbi:MAG TPA: DEAD/DEAH box helicase, partial [Microthrixaceae bacterium]|nr:DEAD/DEAH box helicase [Microthrixaceae bacterium]
MTVPVGDPQSFQLDRFQLEAIAEVDAGRSVLVAAPTGSGKTVVADAAIDMALHAGGKTFYTTPIKALSNQKYSDLTARLGAERVGLLTGDTAINGDAPVVVMTTEVLRNMLYAGSGALNDLHVVVLDEVHYLQDAYRGPVWEEVIIGLPLNVQLVCLSATVSNAGELGEWISTVRGPTTTVIEHERPVELENLYLVGDKSSDRDHLLPVLVDGLPNPEGHRFDGDARRGPRGRPIDRRRRFVTPRRVETIERLAEEDLLPAIYFIFSRNACDDAMAITRDAGLRFTDASERERIRAIIDTSVAVLGDADLDVLGFDMWAAALEQGIAAHHAGLVPAFKEAVERCFVEGLVKVVFATETLALGINMPARSVIIEKLTKFNGDTHEFLTPAQFTQLTGRAGRRGIDDEGFSVVLWSPFVSFAQVAALAGSR